MNELPACLDHIRQSIEEIKKHTDDPASARELERILWESILELAAKLSPVPWSSLAKEALKTREIKYPKWTD